MTEFVSSSLERELKKYNKLNFIPVVGQTFNFNKEVVILPKVSNQRVFEVDSEVKTYFKSQSLEIYNFCKENNFEIQDFLDVYKNKISFKPLKYTIKSLHLKALRTFFKLNLTEDNLKLYNGSWRNSNFIGSGFLEEIDNFGNIVFSKIDYKNTNYHSFKNTRINGDELITLENLGLLKSLRKVSIDELIEYRKKYSMRILYKIQKKGNFLNIMFCLELPEKLLKSEDSVLHRIEFKVSQEIFQNVLSMELLRKKLIKEFSMESKFISLNDIKKEKLLWLTENKDITSRHLTEDEIEFFEDRILPILKKIRKQCSWWELEIIFKEFEQFYKEFNNRDASIPSAPDTSKFTATVSGWIKFDKNFSVSGGYYGFSRSFTYGLKIGGNFNYGNPRFLMNYILNYIKCTYGLPVYGEGEKPSIQKTDGTNWSAIGVGY